MQLKKSGPLLAAAVVTFLSVGCQTYERKPLDLAEHSDAWHARSPVSQPVLEFASQLDEQSDRPTTFDPSDGISIAEGEVIALVFNADLRLARARAEVAAATADNAGLWEDPVFQIDVLRITESVANPWIVSPGLALTIPLSGRLEAEKDRADAAVQAELYRVAEAEWNVRLQLRRTWARWSALQLRIDETRALLDGLDSLVASTSRLAEAGELVRTEAALFAIERLQQRTKLRRFEGEATEVELGLRMQLGLAPEAPVTFVAALHVDDLLVNASADVAVTNLTLARLRAEYEVAEQSLRRAILKQYPDLTIGPAYESDEGQSRVGFLGAIPIPILNANRQEIAETTAARALARAEIETMYERTIGALAAVRVRAQSLADQRTAIEMDVIPLVDAQLKDARQLLQLGEGGALVLLESLTRAQDTKLELIDLRLRQVVTASEFDMLVGPKLPTTIDRSSADDGEVNP